MGEVFLDSENLFFGFGWTPSATSQHERREYLGFFAPTQSLKELVDVLAVESLASAAVHALMAWVGGHFAELGHELKGAQAFGKKDRGVQAVRTALAVEGVQLITVPWGKDVAEEWILGRLDQAGWRRGPYVIGSSDRKVPNRMNEVLGADPRVTATLVMRPDIFESRRHVWFDAGDHDGEPLFPHLREYGVGHVALHRITEQWLAEQSSGRLRRATPPPVSQPPPAPDDAARLDDDRVWNVVESRLPPKPSAESVLSSAGWVRRCVGRRIPASVARRLRDGVVRLYGDAFETGDGPVSWRKACRAAAAIALVEANPVAPPESLSGSQLDAYREAWTRLMVRPAPDADGGLTVPPADLG